MKLLATMTQEFDTEVVESCELQSIIATEHEEQ